MDFYAVAMLAYAALLVWLLYRREIAAWWQRNRPQPLTPIPRVYWQAIRDALHANPEPEGGD